MPSRPKTLRGWIPLCSLLALTGCATVPAGWHPQTWAGDHVSASVRRAQEGKSLQCSDPAFDGYACMSYEDLRMLARKCGAP